MTSEVFFKSDTSDNKLNGFDKQNINETDHEKSPLKNIKSSPKEEFVSSDFVDEESTDESSSSNCSAKIELDLADVIDSCSLVDGKIINVWESSSQSDDEIVYDVNAMQGGIHPQSDFSSDYDDENDEGFPITTSFCQIIVPKNRSENAKGKHNGSLKAPSSQSHLANTSGNADVDVMLDLYRQMCRNNSGEKFQDESKENFSDFKNERRFDPASPSNLDLSEENKVEFKSMVETRNLWRTSSKQEASVEEIKPLGSRRQQNCNGRKVWNSTRLSSYIKSAKGLKKRFSFKKTSLTAEKSADTTCVITRPTGKKSDMRKARLGEQQSPSSSPINNSRSKISFDKEFQDCLSRISSNQMEMDLVGKFKRSSKSDRESGVEQELKIPNTSFQNFVSNTKNNKFNHYIIKPINELVEPIVTDQISTCETKPYCQRQDHEHFFSNLVDGRKKNNLNEDFLTSEIAGGDSQKNSLKNTACSDSSSSDQLENDGKNIEDYSPKQNNQKLQPNTITSQRADGSRSFSTKENCVTQQTFEEKTVQDQFSIAENLSPIHNELKKEIATSPCFHAENKLLVEPANTINVMWLNVKDETLREPTQTESFPKENESRSECLLEVNVATTEFLLSKNDEDDFAIENRTVFVSKNNEKASQNRTSNEVKQNDKPCTSLTNNDADNVEIQNEKINPNTKITKVSDKIFEKNEENFSKVFPSKSSHTKSLIDDHDKELLQKLLTAPKRFPQHHRNTSTLQRRKTKLKESPIAPELDLSVSRRGGEIESAKKINGPLNKEKSSESVMERRGRPSSRNLDYNSFQEINSSERLYHSSRTSRSDLKKGNPFHHFDNACGPPLYRPLMHSPQQPQAPSVQYYETAGLNLTADLYFRGQRPNKPDSQWPLSFYPPIIQGDKRNFMFRPQLSPHHSQHQPPIEYQPDFHHAQKYHRHYGPNFKQMMLQPKHQSMMPENFELYEEEYDGEDDDDAEVSSLRSWFNEIEDNCTRLSSYHDDFGMKEMVSGYEDYNDGHNKNYSELSYHDLKEYAPQPYQPFNNHNSIHSGQHPSFQPSLDEKIFKNVHQNYVDDEKEVYAEFMEAFSRELGDPRLCLREKQFRCELFKEMQRLQPIVKWDQLIHFYDVTMDLFYRIRELPVTGEEKDRESRKLLESMIDKVLYQNQVDRRHMHCLPENAPYLYDEQASYDPIRCRSQLCKVWNERGVCTEKERCPYVHRCIYCAEASGVNADHPMLECPN